MAAIPTRELAELRVADANETDDFDDDDDDEIQEDGVELGFVSKMDAPLDAKLLHDNSDWSTWDGGLVGGKPRWLSAAGVPASERLACSECATPLSFLLQIYCPLDDQPDAFHRSLYVFCCRKPGCSRQGR
jgi:pre-rRNA-processing protein TSR4